MQYKHREERITALLYVNQLKRINSIKKIQNAVEINDKCGNTKYNKKL